MSYYDHIVEIYEGAFQIAKEAAWPRIKARLEEAGEGADRMEIAGEEVAAELPAAIKESERRVFAQLAAEGE